MSSPSIVALFKHEHPEFAGVPDGEILAAINVASTPAAPEGHPAQVTPEPQTQGSSYGDFLQGAGHHAVNTALSLGEMMRSAPGGELLKQGGDIAARLFGYQDPGIQEEPNLADRIAAERGAVNTLAPPPPVNTASQAGAFTAGAAETLATLPVSEALAAPAGMGMLGRAAIGGAREAALAGATTAAQEGNTQDVGNSATLAGIMGGAGPVLGATGNALSKHLAGNLLTTPREMVKRGASAAAGLQESGVIAGGAESLWKQLDKAGEASTNKTLEFLRQKGYTGSIFDTGEVSQIIHDAKAEVMLHRGLDTSTKRTIENKLNGLLDEFSMKGKQFLNAEEMLKLRRQLGEATNWSKGEVETAAEFSKGVRQDMYGKINAMLEEKFPDIAAYNKRDFNLLTARDAAEGLLGKPSGSQEGFLVRRGVPLGLGAAGALLGGGAGYVGGGSTGAALGGLLGGAAMTSPAAITTLVQGLKNSPEATKMSEILARVFGIAPEIANDPQVQGGPTR